jgi:hypothetical protein
MSIQGFTDRRRLPGPEKSFPPVYDAPEEPLTTTGNGKGKGRADGREAEEMRDVCELRVFARGVGEVMG